MLKYAISFGLVAFLLMAEGGPAANADSKLPDPSNAGVVDKLFRLGSVAEVVGIWLA